MIISIDVGIRHLSFCKMSVDLEKQVNIHKWDVIDLSREEKFPTCCQQMKNKVCGKKATWTHCGNTFYCGTHANTCSIEKAPSNYAKIRDKKKLSKKDYTELGEKYIISDTSFFKTQTEVLDYIYQNTLTPLKKRSSASDCNLIDVGIVLSQKLPSIMKLDDVDKILIENQIGPLAIRMKCVQGMLTQFFIEKGIKDITFVSSSNKLKHFAVPKKNYKERKASGIMVTQQYITDNSLLNKWIVHFNKHKKKDDLADSFLQGLWYIKDS